MHIEDRDFFKLRDYMRETFGINLEKKRTLIEGRLSNTITQAGFEGFHDYLEDVYKDKTGVKMNSIVTKLTTNYTYFMREDAHYKFMEQVALPHWTSVIRDNDLRVWSAGCASGEEAYTTAMLLNEYFGPAKRNWDTTVLATDISSRVLEIGRGGIYPSAHLEHLPAAWKTKYFTKHGADEYKLTESIKKEVVFSTFNLMGDFSRFRKKFHIIFCRNVMIYFNSQTKAELAHKFYGALEPGGYLFIGMSETLSGISDEFEQVSPAIYRKGTR